LYYITAIIIDHTIAEFRTSSNILRMIEIESPF